MDKTDNSSDESGEESCTPLEMRTIAQSVNDKLLPKMSKEKYNAAYLTFTNWRKSKNEKVMTENILLAYFIELSEKLKPPSLWSIYSMLKNTMKINDNLDIGKYSELTAFLKRMSDGYRGNKSKVLSVDNIEKFLSEAPDEKYLATKVNENTHKRKHLICRKHTYTYVLRHISIFYLFFKQTKNIFKVISITM